MKIYDFTIEYRNSPIGLDVLPRFSWKINSEKSSTQQNWYQIVVKKDEKVVWDSGRVESSQSVLVEYIGSELEPLTEYSVHLEVETNHQERENTVTKFETGLMQEENFEAKWITDSKTAALNNNPSFKKQFDLSTKEIKRARLYVTALGVYKPFVNKQAIDESHLAPGWTSYDSRLQYQTYDITHLLIDGNNEIDITLGNGWYKGYLNGEGENCFYGDELALLAKVAITYEDGTSESLGTNLDWTVEDSKIVESELYFGETQNLKTKPKTGEVVYYQPDKEFKITSQECEMVKITKRLPVVEKIITPKNEVVLDFGQNMAGVVEITLPAKQSESLVLYHGEVLDKHGNFYNENYRTAISKDEYIYDEEHIGIKVIPKFTYHGFRYIKVEGVLPDVDISNFTACVMHTDMKQIGSFVSNNQKINRLQQNIEWGQRSNYFDIPTDCPQRDERLGWTGDAQIFAETGSFNFNTALFFKKWLRDVAVESNEEIGIPQIVPNVVGDTIGTSIWSDCATIIPWTVYQTYGDKQVLKEQYQNMKLWVEYIKRHTDNEVLWKNGFQRGDWLSLDSDASLNLMSGGTDKDLIANIYYAISTDIVAKSAKLLGNEADYIQYQNLYKDIVEALNEEYVTKTGRLVSETQTACAMLLQFDLLKEEHRKVVASTLVNNVMLHKGKLSTGFVGTAFLCQALTKYENHKAAEDIFFTEDFPGWLYSVNEGATTIWERWNSILPNGDFDQSGMNSLNHYTFGSIGNWMYQKIGGIEPLEAGYKKFMIKPTPTRTLTDVEVKYDSMYGMISSKIAIDGNQFNLEIEVPCNTSAVVILPESNEEIEVGSGKHIFSCTISRNLAETKYSMNTVFETIYMDKAARAIMEEIIPGMKENIAFDYMKDKTLQELANLTPQMNGFFERALDEVNKIYK